MSSIMVTVEGLDEFRSACERFPQDGVEKLDRAFEVVAMRWRDRTKTLPPVSVRTTGYGVMGLPTDTGHLMQTIDERKLSVLEYEIRGNCDYSGFVHGGTSKMPARPFFQWMLEDFGGLTQAEDVITKAMKEYFGA